MTRYKITMTEQQEADLASIKNQFYSMVDSKYRVGQLEHGGNLYDMGALELVNQAILEAIDQFVYLITLRDRLIALSGPPASIDPGVPPEVE